MYSTISELDSNRMTKTEIENDFLQLENHRQEIKSSLERLLNRRKEEQSKIEEYELKSKEFSNILQMKENRKNFLEETEKEKEGYIKSVRLLLLDCEKNENLRKGVHGVLADLITVPKEYEIAIEMSLGQALQNIVTDTEETAKKLVEYLRENKLGRASFLPISSVRGKKLERLIKNALPGVIGIASDLIKYNKQYEQIIMNLLGKTVIVDNMETGVILARQNQYSFRIVTLEGDIISSSGSITGGWIAQKTVNILGRKQEIQTLEQEIKQIKHKLEKTKKEQVEYEENIQANIEELNSLEKQMSEIEISYATEKQKINLLNENIIKLEERLNRLKLESEKLKSDKKTSQNLVESAHTEIEKIDKENNELNNIVSEFAKSNKDNQKYIDDLNFDITNLRISVSSFDESENSIDEIVARIDEDIKNTQQSVENKRLLRNKIAEEEKRLKDQIDITGNKIEEIKKKAEDGTKHMEMFKEQKTQKIKLQEENERKQEEQRTHIDILKEQISKIDVKKSKLEIELEQIVNKMWEDYEITPSVAKEYKKPDNIAETNKMVTNLRNDIKQLGSINIDAIEEYKKTKERYDFMCEQRLDLENASAKLKKMITEITNTMKQQFEQQFKLINKNFGEVFKELFGGGKAELRLSDEENILESGIEIEAEPPGKKLQNMMLLSGGEKAFTAIALLFAILKINPAPFCVLDEIEAALDDINVYRFADYLKKFARDSQFLVITHRKGTMEAADTVYGITMEENGISKLLSMKLA